MRRGFDSLLVDDGALTPSFRIKHRPQVLLSIKPRAIMKVKNHTSPGIKDDRLDSLNRLILRVFKRELGKFSIHIAIDSSMVGKNAMRIEIGHHPNTPLSNFIVRCGKKIGRMKASRFIVSPPRLLEQKVLLSLKNPRRES